MLRIVQRVSMDLLDKMATFVRVIEAGSFSAAAKQLGVSAAAVSRQIATLEAELGQPLITRSTRRMAITELGRGYYERCLRILREVEDAQAIGHSDGMEGTLRVSASVTFGLENVVPVLPSLLAKFPGLRVDLRLEDRLLDAILQGVDVAVRVGAAAPESSDMVAHRLSSFRRVLVAAPSYLRRRGEPKTPESLARHSALTHLAGRIAESWTLTDGEREARVSLDVRLRSNALHAVRELAIAGAGIALLPEWMVFGELERRRVRRVLPAWHSGPVTVLALHRAEHRGAPRVRAFIEHLRKALSKYPGAGAHAG